MNGLFSRSRWGQFSTNKALFIIIIWFVFPFVILGKFSFIHTGDNFEFNVAHLMALGIEGLNPGFWNPVTSSGTDTIAIGIVGEINRVLFFYFPGWLAYQLLIVVQTVAAILGSYLFCRYLFKLTSFASILPSIIFGLMIPGQLHFSIIAFLPALILSLSYLLENSRSYRAWGLSLIIFFWVSETAYISWLIPFPSIVLIGWFLFVEKRQSLRQWVIIICFALLLQAFRYEDIVALIQFAPHAHMKLGRTLPSSSDVLAWPPLLRENLVIICIGLFGYSWIVMESRPPIMRGLALFLVVGIVAEPIAVLMQIYLAEQLPFIQGFNVAKITRLFEVIVWLSSAFAVQPILEGLKENGQKRTLSWGAFFFLIAVVLFYGVSQKIDQMRDWVTNGNYVSNLESPVIEKFKKDIKNTIVPARAEMFQIYSTYLQPYGIETAGGYEPLYMRRYYEFWSTILEPWGKSEPDPTLMDIFEEWPYFRSIRLYLTTYTHQPERRFNDLYRLNLLSMVNVAWIFSRDKLTDPELKLVYGDFKPWSSLSQSEKIATNLKANFRGREHLFVYNNLQALPRFISPSRVKVFKDGQAVLKAMANSTIAELSDSLFLSKSDLPNRLDPSLRFSKLSFKPVLYENDKIELVGEANEKGLLIGFNAWSPFWTAEIDGNPAKIIPANHAFWGLIIPKGTRRIVFRYKRS
jgi:hypothetical protein